MASFGAVVNKASSFTSASHFKMAILRGSQWILLFAAFAIARGDGC